MSPDKYPSMFSPQMEAIVYLCLKKGRESHLWSVTDAVVLCQTMHQETVLAAKMLKVFTAAVVNICEFSLFACIQSYLTWHGKCMLINFCAKRKHVYTLK